MQGALAAQVEFSGCWCNMSLLPKLIERNTSHLAKSNFDYSERYVKTSTALRGMRTFIDKIWDDSRIWDDRYVWDE